MLSICKYLSKSEIGQLLIGLIFIVSQIWFDLKLPDYMSDITRLVETPGSNMHDIWIAGGKMLLISLGSVLCAIATGYVAARVGASFSQRLRSLEFRKVESFGPAEMNRFSTASLITRSTNDITQIQMFVTMGLLLLVKSPIMAVWAVCKIAGKGVDWTVATAVAVGVLLVVIGVIMAMVVPKFRSMQRLTDNINLVARENLTGLRVVRAYNAEDYQEAKYDKANAELSNTYLFTNRSMSVMMPLINTVMNGLMLAIYWIGAYLINAADLKDKLTLFSNMVVFSSYSVQVIMSFLLMSMVFVLLPRADVSANRILEVLDTNPLVTDGAETSSNGIAATAATTSKGTVEFKNVSFAYPDSREAMLEGITFSAQPGQTVAFIGSTGSGKSSLVNLVPRFYDATEGQVLVDGVDVRDYTLKDLRDKIGYVPQQSVLFKGTVASNIRYGDRPKDSADVELVDTSSIQGRRREAELMKHADDVQDPGDEQQVRAAAEVAQADEFIETM
ncbi:MAG: ABC transporter ATP-binding protein, partial [Bifidobacterium subtile]|nr:ABC transporter ATP-binding protein [Bifidobacterium subtile]